METPENIKKLAMRTQGKRTKMYTVIDDHLSQIQEIADRAVDRLGRILIEKGASPADVIAFECAVEGRRAIEILAVTTEDIENHRGSPQEAIFDLIAGYESEGMGLTSIAEHLAVGIPLDD